MTVQQRKLELPVHLTKFFNMDESHTVKRLLVVVSKVSIVGRGWHPWP